MKAKDLREKSVDDLRELEKTSLRAVFDARFKNFTNRLDDTSAIKKARREVARIKTLLREQAAGVTAKAPPVKAKKAAPEAAASPPAAAESKPAKAAKKSSAKVKAAEATSAAPKAEKPAKKTTKKSEAK